MLRVLCVPCSRSDVWDEKITTFPGLYFAATGWIKLLDLLSSLWTATTGDEIPSDGPAFLLKLRLMNSVFNVASFILLYNIYRHKKVRAERQAGVSIGLDMVVPLPLRAVSSTPSRPRRTRCR